MSGETTGYAYTVKVNTGTVGSPTWTPVASQSNVSFNPTQNMIDVSSKESLDEEVLPGKRSETIDFDAMFIRSGADFAKLRDAVRAGTKIQIMRVEAGSNFEWAYGYLENMPQNFSQDAPAEISFSVRRTGGWTAI